MEFETPSMYEVEDMIAQARQARSAYFHTLMRQLFHAVAERVSNLAAPHPTARHV